ncbi:MAG: hypothetical protein NZ742_11665 [Acidobacteria bacterium]|nr:hypothetical protein [Acidobacteriota bacterium]MDW7985273.1 hypothetical protein [Acidobacteriota bacterium]
MHSKKKSQAVLEWTGVQETASAASPGPEGEAPSPPAWEVLYEGAYMPRRVRGSWRGGVLG